MARLFDDASTQYLEYNGTIVTAAPLTLACWFRSNDTAASQTLISIGDGASVNNYFLIAANGDQVGDPIRAVARGTADNPASTTAGFTANTWHHAAGVFTSSTDRAAFLDGGNKGTNAVAGTPAGLDRTAIGRLYRSVPTSYMSGEIAVPAIWDVALTDAEVAMLALGIVPWLVRPSNLVACWPMFGYSSPELDMIGSIGMTVTGATVADQPRLIYPTKRKLFLPAAAAVTTKNYYSGGFANAKRISRGFGW